MKHSRLASVLALTLMAATAGMAGTASARSATMPSCDYDCMSNAHKHCHCPHDASVYAARNPDQVIVTDTHVEIKSDTITVTNVSPANNSDGSNIPDFVKDKTKDLNEWSYEQHIGE